MRFKKYLPDLPDILYYAGLVNLGYGLWLIYPPAMFVIVGIILMLMGWGLGYGAN